MGAGGVCRLPSPMAEALDLPVTVAWALPC
jgi:hypothetical protein